MKLPNFRTFWSDLWYFMHWKDFAVRCLVGGIVVGAVWSHLFNTGWGFVFGLGLFPIVVFGVFYAIEVLRINW
jgi:hypothetical protein